MSDRVRRAYIARYPYPKHRDDEPEEEILFRAPYCNAEINAEWDRLVAERKPGDPMLQMWYCDEAQTVLAATTSYRLREPTNA